MNQETERQFANVISSHINRGRMGLVGAESTIIDLKVWETQWDTHLKMVGYLPEDLINLARTHTRIESVLTERAILSRNVSDTDRVLLFEKLAENGPKAWAREQLLAVCGLTESTLQEELGRLEEATL